MLRAMDLDPNEGMLPAIGLDMFKTRKLQSPLSLTLQAVQLTMLLPSLAGNLQRDLRVLER
jgi:hypothetical protein